MKVSPKRKNVIRKEPIPAKLVGQAFIDPTYDTGFQELFDSPKALKGISIWICNFDLPELCGKYIDEWAIYSRNSLENGEKEPVFAKNKYIIISLANFNKSASEVKTATDAWLYLLKNAGTENEMPSFGNSAIEDALERIRIDNLDDETLKAMEREMVTKEEIECRLAGAKIETRKATQIDVAKILVEAGKLSIDDAIALLHVPETTARRWKKKKV